MYSFITADLLTVRAEKPGRRPMSEITISLMTYTSTQEKYTAGPQRLDHRVFFSIDHWAF